MGKTREKEEGEWAREEGRGQGQGKLKRLFRYNTSEQEEMDTTTRFPPPFLGQLHLLPAANAG